MEASTSQHYPMAKTNNQKPQYFHEPNQVLKQQHYQQQIRLLDHDQFDAVIIRNLTYELGRGRNRKLILNKINLTVPEGSIYGLLGPSGCGKTTMLRCLVGRIRPRSGSVLVFGFKPGDSRSQVPGRHVGYMPQEISIYEDFTIEETLIYFGKINRLHMAEIEQRIGFLVRFLDLPPKSRLVVSLSGGQKRRVSLAAALVHSPPLLILDEPTVGVDPLLRQGIWRHLVSLTQTERISVIITTHYIEEARQANVVGLMRHGKILAEDSPDELMQLHQLTNLEDVFLKLCVTDSARRVANMAPPVATAAAAVVAKTANKQHVASARPRSQSSRKRRRKRLNDGPSSLASSLDSSDGDGLKASPVGAKPSASSTQTVRIHTATNRIEYLQAELSGSYTNETLELSSDELSSNLQPLSSDRHSIKGPKAISDTAAGQAQVGPLADTRALGADYLNTQALKWAARRSNALSMLTFRINNAPIVPLATTTTTTTPTNNCNLHEKRTGLYQWWRILMAVTWKNYIRLRRNPPVLMFQFMLPAIQVILFCLCIGGEPFDVPLAVVNDESTPHSSLQFLDGLNRKVIRQIKYDNLSSAMEAVRRGHVWGALHIPDKYSQNLQSRLIMGEEVTNETLSNGTIRVYPDLTNLHLALALETTFRESFLKFAQNSLEELGYDRSLASLPIQLGKPVYGSLKKDSYLEFMAPGVVISISYVMATGLTALAFILERRDGLLERSLVSGVDTSQILLAHAINQVVVMVIQIFLVLGCTFFVFEIPSRGPFFWVVLLILLQGCTGMAFGLLVSAICKEENTAVMMLVGSFYTNFILAGIIWPIEAMPHWLRPLSYAQPQTLPTDTLRHILSRGWGITETGVLIGFAVTIGWLAAFLLAAGLMFKYSS